MSSQTITVHLSASRAVMLIQSHCLTRSPCSDCEEASGLPSDHDSLPGPSSRVRGYVRSPWLLGHLLVFFLTLESRRVTCRMLSPWVCPGSLVLRHGRTPLCPRWGGWGTASL